MPETALLTPGQAIAERWALELRLRTELMEALTAEPMALTAASFPGWARRVTRAIRELSYLPRWAERFLLDSGPTDEEQAAESAERWARTLATAAFAEGQLRVFAAQQLQYKQWVCRPDDNVRHSHRVADGQVRAISQAFLVGGYRMQYPADATTAPIEEWVNCRCVVIAKRG